MADDLDPAAVERAAEAAAEHIGWQAGMYDAIRAALAAAGPLVTPDRPGDAVTSDWDTWVAQHNAQVAARAQADLVSLLRELVDPDPCDFDHSGGCQAHGYLSLTPGQTCPVQDAKDAIDRADRIERQEGER